MMSLKQRDKRMTGDKRGTNRWGQTIECCCFGRDFDFDSKFNWNLLRAWARNNIIGFIFKKTKSLAASQRMSGFKRCQSRKGRTKRLLQRI